MSKSDLLLRRYTRDFLEETTMTGLAEYAARLLRRLWIAIGMARPPGPIATLLRELGPYAAIELVLPGGSLLALLLWLYRRRWKVAPPITSHTADVFSAQARRLARTPLS
ncbi:MAG: hypothetical protein ACRDQZ_13980 [Mycobacteriales bacterium]